MRRDHTGMRGRDKQTLPGDMTLCQEAHDGTLPLNVHRVLMVVMVIKKHGGVSKGIRVSRKREPFVLERI